MDCSSVYIYGVQNFGTWILKRESAHKMAHIFSVFSRQKYQAKFFKRLR
jgi:hypothetical protein